MQFLDDLISIFVAKNMGESGWINPFITRCSIYFAYEKHQNLERLQIALTLG